MSDARLLVIYTSPFYAGAYARNDRMFIALTMVMVRAVPVPLLSIDILVIKK
ncbi:hypothetical protein [Saezia sanguinis]|uniref:hypothetical protein n=1 Tax=Saezia sanguinis TaxID=1965230 RepID=UPI0030DDCBE1